MELTEEGQQVLAIVRRVLRDRTDWGRPRASLLMEEIEQAARYPGWAPSAWEPRGSAGGWCSWRWRSSTRWSR
jgi:hypothetical protein